jgi:hypothetical protein
MSNLGLREEATAPMDEEGGAVAVWGSRVNLHRSEQGLFDT